MTGHVISRVRIRPEAGFNSLRPLASGAYGLHQMLWRLYPDRTRFIFRETRDHVGEYLVVSDQSPHTEREDLFNVECKPYQPQLLEGQNLEFIVRACATVCRDKKRHDIVQDRRAQGDTRPRLEIANDVGPAWLANQGLRSGFDVLHCQVDGYEQHRTSRRNGGVRIQFSTLDFSGVLSVTDPIQFTKMLQNGIGRAKAFGAGLVLVRRIA